MSSTFEHFIDKYYLLLDDTWKKSVNDSQLRNKIVLHKLNLLQKGDVEWNSYIDEIIETVGSHDHLLGLISFHFENIEFSEVVDFSGFLIPFRTYFRNCQFRKELNLKRANIRQLLSFTDCKFNDKFEISESNSSSNLEFSKCEFIDEFMIISSRFEKNIIFNKQCTFYKNVCFIFSNFEGSILLGDSKFENHLPDIRESTFDRSIDLTSIEYSEDKIYKKIKENLANSTEGKISLDGDYSNLNLLKMLSEKNGDFKSRTNFFALALKTNKLTDTWLMKRVTEFYSATSNFGRSMARPLISLLILLLLVFTVNHLFNDFKPTECATTYKAEWILVIQRSLPFGLGFDETTFECAKQIVGKGRAMPILVQFINMIQIVLSYALWFLFLLSIRNRFKL